MIKVVHAVALIALICLIQGATATTGVVIGDSIARGHNESRLQFNLALHECYLFIPNSYGSWAWELENLTGWKWYNQAMSSANTTTVWNRWNRDVLGADVTESFRNGSFIRDYWYQPLRTLDHKPDYVLVGVGTGDISANLSLEAAENRIAMMAQSAHAHGIKALFYTVIPREEVNQANLTALNDWMMSNITQYGARVWDAQGFFQDPVNTTDFKTEYYDFDHVHPNVGGIDQATIALWNDNRDFFVEVAPEETPIPTWLTVPPTMVMVTDSIVHGSPYYPTTLDIKPNIKQHPTFESNSSTMLDELLWTIEAVNKGFTKV